MAQTKDIDQDLLGRPIESAQDVVNDIFAMPVDAQLGILRTVVPKILARLKGPQLEGFLRDLQDEIDKADRGEPSYDMRTDVPSQLH